MRTSARRSATSSSTCAKAEDNVSVGSGTTAKQGNGKWIWEEFAFEPLSGEYFALAPPTNKCKRAESKIFTYPDDN